MPIRMMPCADGVCVCDACGFRRAPQDRRPFMPHLCQPRPGLGDMVASGLASVGITQERVTRLLGRPCGCPERQAALNRLGAKLGLPPGRS